MYPHTLHQADQPIVNVTAVSVRYNGNLALDKITFHLHAGERVAVVGPNGAGKSTLFKLIAGVLSPSEGEVSIYGTLPGKHLCIGYVPQRSEVDWKFPVTIADVVMMGRIAKLGIGGWPRKRDWDLVYSALRTVQLESLAQRQISELSGGQQQRMFIARALAQEAELMLMDEPLSGLDLPSQEGILSLLDELQKKNVTVMIATHDLEQARQYFDRVMLLNHRLLGFGPAEEVFRPENLLQAYGGRIQLVGEDNQIIAVGDPGCCGQGIEDGHTH